MAGAQCIVGILWPPEAKEGRLGVCQELTVLWLFSAPQDPSVEKWWTRMVGYQQMALAHGKYLSSRPGLPALLLVQSAGGH